MATGFSQAGQAVQQAIIEEVIGQLLSCLLLNQIKPKASNQLGFPCGYVPSGSVQHPCGQAASQPPSASQAIKVSRSGGTSSVREPIEITPSLLERVSYPELRRSLVQQFVLLTDDERRLWLNNLLFIMTPDLRQLNDKVGKVRDYRSFGQQRNFLLGGESGMGKTTYLNCGMCQ